VGEQRVQPVDGLRAGTDQVVAVFGEGTQGGDRFIDDRGVEPGGGVRGDADGKGVGLVGLAAVPGRQQPDAAGQFAGTSTTSMPSADSREVSKSRHPGVIGLS
jgi:hypothetical protein